MARMVLKHENRYCNLCRQTTRHEVKQDSHACLRCGTLKYPPQLLKRRKTRGGK